METGKVAAAGVFNCSTVLGMDGAAQRSLMETVGNRASPDECSRRQLRNSSYHGPDRLESLKDETVADLETLICVPRFLIGWSLFCDHASLGIGITTDLAIELATYPVVAAFFQEDVKLVGVATHVMDFIIHKADLQRQFTLVC